MAKGKQPAADSQVPLVNPANSGGLPEGLQGGLERLSGFDLSDVQVHYNSHQPAQMGAHAFAQGNQIHLGPGQEKHLPHEAWHVVQQKQGRVKPSVAPNGPAPVDEAKRMGTKAVLGGGSA